MPPISTGFVISSGQTNYFAYLLVHLFEVIVGLIASVIFRGSELFSTYVTFRVIVRVLLLTRVVKFCFRGEAGLVRIGDSTARGIKYITTRQLVTFDQTEQLILD